MIRVVTDSTCDLPASTVEKYGIKINPEIHKEVKDRYALLDLAPYSGFINPKFVITTENGQIKDIQLDYSQNYVDQMLEYGKKYRLLKK